MIKHSILAVLLIISMTGIAQEKTALPPDLKQAPDLAWKYSLKAPVYSSPVISESTVYFGCLDSVFYALDLVTGNVKWAFTTVGYRNNYLKYFKEDDTYRDDIYSIIKSNEQFLEVEEELGGIFSSPAIVPGYLVFTSTEGSVYCLKSKE